MDLPEGFTRRAKLYVNEELSALKSISAETINLINDLSQGKISLSDFVERPPEDIGKKSTNLIYLYSKYGKDSAIQSIHLHMNGFIFDKIFASMSGLSDLISHLSKFYNLEMK